MDISGLNGMSEYASSLAASQSAEKLGESAKSAQSDEEMLEACKEFESYLWEQVIKSMKDTADVFSEKETDQQLDYFMGSAISEVAKEMTEQTLGSNSLAMQMYEQMKRNSGGLTIEEIEELQAQSGVTASSEEGE